MGAEKMIEKASDLKENLGEKITINGEEYTFEILTDGGGDWCVFYGKTYQIWATVYFQAHNTTPIEIRDKEGNDIGMGWYDEIPNKIFKDWDDYSSQIVEKVEGMINEKKEG